jgi:outer membrane protein OmpA-like peptidoglycan-associated protein/Tol biopolymer transport system component
MHRRILLLVWIGFSFPAAAQQPAPVVPAFDSMAYYSATRKPAISDAVISEYAATIQADGKTMIVQSNLANKVGRWRLFEHQLQLDGKWGPAKSLDSINDNLDSTSHAGGPSISFDGNMLFFFMNNDIFYSLRQKNGWGRHQSIGAPVNTSDYEGFPSISADGKSLYFVGANANGPTSKDLKKKVAFCTCILKSTRQADGTWGKPEKLPFPINLDCEKAPRIMADNKTLIFSSNRPGGKGGYDLYLSRLNDLGNWSTPAPLNFVNTEQDDQSPSISAQGDLMYFTNNAKDIYSVVIPYNLRQFKNNILNGYVTDQDTRQGLGVEILVTDAFTSEVVMQLNNNPDDGRYTVVLPVGRSFNIEFKREGYSSYTYAMDLTDVSSYRELQQSIELFKSAKLTLNVNDKEIFEPLASEIKIREKGKNEFLKDVDVKSGHYTVDLPLGADYEIIISSPMFKGAIVDLNLKGLIIYREFEKFVELVPEKREVMVNVADLQNNSKVKAKVVLKNKNRDETIEVTGNQMVALRAGDRYEIEVSSDQGYAFDSRTIDMTEGGQKALDFKLQKLEMDAKLTLKDINFESNSAKLSDVSYTELERVVKLLSENPTLKVEIAAHTDDVGSDVYNQILSQKRAQSVVDFLVSNKVIGERFIAKGYGEKVAKVPNSSEENRLVNRRVELKIVGI